MSRESSQRWSYLRKLMEVLEYIWIYNMYPENMLRHYWDGKMWEPTRRVHSQESPGSSECQVSGWLVKHHVQVLQIVFQGSWNYIKLPILGDQIMDHYGKFQGFRFQKLVRCSGWQFLVSRACAVRPVLTTSWQLKVGVSEKIPTKRSEIESTN